MVTRIPAPPPAPAADETGNDDAPGGAPELLALAQTFDPMEAAPTPAEQAEATPENCTADDLLPLLELLRTAGEDSFTWWDRYRSTWSDDRLAKIADAGARCLNHYGLDLGALLGHPLVGLAVAVVPPSIATVVAVRQHSAQQAQLQRQARQAGQTVPTGPVTP